MPLIEEQVINTYHWMTMADFSDLVTIAEMTPGPIAVNAAIFVGNQAAGIPGALIATLGVILPKNTGNSAWCRAFWGRFDQRSSR